MYKNTKYSNVCKHNLSYVLSVFNAEAPVQCSKTKNNHIWVEICSGMKFESLNFMSQSTIDDRRDLFCQLCVISGQIRDPLLAIYGTLF